jgi:glycerol-3-phosphate dehydrogenase
MHRDPAALADGTFDVVVVGGGIFGACVAWDAAHRGLSVALVERGDFGAGTSAHSFKMVHGGIRYLQHADLIRVRHSCAERTALLKMAPHLVRPLPIMIPTYGHGMKGKAVLRAGTTLYDLVTFDRNRGIRDPARRIPPARFLSRRQVLEQFPDLDPAGLTGAATFCDGQMYNPPRLVLAFLRSAVAAGARAANYVEATGFLRDGDRVTGIRAVDRFGGGALEVRGRVVVNAAGPWAEPLLATRLGTPLDPAGTYSRDACFVVRRRFPGPYALALTGTTRDPDAVLSRSARHMFLVPWRGFTLVGVWHVVHGAGPDDFTVTDGELEAFMGEINAIYPSLALTLDDVCVWNAGLVPFGENDPEAKDLSYGKRSRLIDHRETDGLDGLVTLIGVRYTMGRGEAARAVDLVADKLGRALPRIPVGSVPVHGGDIDDFEGFAAETARRHAGVLTPAVARSLAHNHGTALGGVVDLAEKNPDWAAPVGEGVIGAEVVHAVREEMAVRLGDVVLRRTDLGSGADPGGGAIDACGRLMAEELGWDAATTEAEVAAVKRTLAEHRPTGTAVPVSGG